MCVCVCVCIFLVFFFFSRILGQVLLLQLLFIYCTWIVAAKFDLSNNFQPISAHRTLYTDPQISLFSNFVIKNGSHGTIHTFKNYFTTVFFSFQLYPNRHLVLKLIRLWLVYVFNKSVFQFSINFFFKNDILLCGLRAHVSKIQIIIIPSFLLLHSTILANPRY